MWKPVWHVSVISRTDSCECHAFYTTYSFLGEDKPSVIGEMYE